MAENRPSPLLWPMAYTTACTTVQAVITSEILVESCDFYTFQCIERLRQGSWNRNIVIAFPNEKLEQHGFAMVKTGRSYTLLTDLLTGRRTDRRISCERYSALCIASRITNEGAGPGRQCD